MDQKAMDHDGLQNNGEKGQLLNLTLTSANNALLLSQIYEISTAYSDPAAGLQNIKKLIDEYNRKQGLNESNPPTPPSTISDTASLVPLSTGDEDDDDEISQASDDMENNISLEEELEGIGDAPLEDRAAMRAALHAKENTRRKQLQESAAEKRHAAEQEGLRLQKVMRNVSVLPPSKPSTSESSAITTSPAKPQPFAKKTVIVDEDEDNDTEQNSPGIICITGSPPRNVVRFGMEFSPVSQGPENTGVEGHRRSVLIQNIPLSFTMHQLLAHIRGGIIVSAKLLPEMAGLGRGQTAIIIFTRAEEADACCRITGTHFQNMCTPKNGNGIRVSFLPMPTYPTRESLVFEKGSAEFSPEEQKQTRCLRIDKFPKQYLNELCIELHLDVRNFPLRLQTLEEVWFEGNTLNMNFTSIREAVKACKTARYFYYGKFSMQTKFGPDPCAILMLGGDVFGNDNLKLASDGCVGLKSLMETVGLAAYSRNNREDFADENGIKCETISTSTKKDQDGTPNDSVQLIDVSLPIERAGTSQGTLPWTAELMKGLELL